MASSDRSSREHLDTVNSKWPSRDALAEASGANRCADFLRVAAATIPQVKDGKLRAPAGGGKTQLRELPDVPTMREAA
jgi:hypothetical protein